MSEKEGDDTTDTEQETTESEGETEGTEDSVEETFEEVEENVEEGIEGAEETFDETVDEAEERTEEISERVEERTDEVLESVDDNVDRLLSEILDTRSRVAVYVGLRQKGTATAEEVAEETGLYPEKVERVFEDLEEDEVVETEAGSDEYEAVSPTELVRRVPESVGGWLSDLITPGSDEDEREETTEIDVE